MKIQDIYYRTKDWVQGNWKQGVTYTLTTVIATCLAASCKNSELEKKIENNEAKPPVEQKDPGKLDWTKTCYLYLVGTASYDKLKVDEEEVPVEIIKGVSKGGTKRGESPPGMVAYYIIELLDEQGGVLYSCETSFGYGHTDYQGKNGQMTGGAVKPSPSDIQLGLELPVHPRASTIKVWSARYDSEKGGVVKTGLAHAPLDIPK